MPPRQNPPEDITDPTPWEIPLWQPPPPGQNPPRQNPTDKIVCDVLWYYHGTIVLVKCLHTKHSVVDEILRIFRFVQWLLFHITCSYQALIIQLAYSFIYVDLVWQSVMLHEVHVSHIEWLLLLSFIMLPYTWQWFIYFVTARNTIKYMTNF